MRRAPPPRAGDIHQSEAEVGGTCGGGHPITSQPVGQFPPFSMEREEDVASGYGKMIAPVVHCACVEAAGWGWKFLQKPGGPQTQAAPFLGKRGKLPQSPGCQCSLLGRFHLDVSKILNFTVQSTLFFPPKFSVFLNYIIIQQAKQLEITSTFHPLQAYIQSTQFNRCLLVSLPGGDGRKQQSLSSPGRPNIFLLGLQQLTCCTSLNFLQVATHSPSLEPQGVF